MTETTELQNKKSRELLALLVGHLCNVTPGEPKTYVNYKYCLERLDLERDDGETYGLALGRQCMGELAEWLMDNNMPAITGLIVNKSGDRMHLPSDEYFDCHGREDEDIAWWDEQIAAAKAFDWSPHVDLS